MIYAVSRSRCGRRRSHRSWPRPVPASGSTSTGNPLLLVERIVEILQHRAHAHHRKQHRYEIPQSAVLCYPLSGARRYWAVKRREFITLLGGAAAAWPLAAGAQQPMKLRTIGLLGATTAPAQKKWTDAFVRRLRELDWIEGRSIAIEYRWAEGRTERVSDVLGCA